MVITRTTKNFWVFICNAGVWLRRVVIRTSTQLRVNVQTGTIPVQPNYTIYM